MFESLQDRLSGVFGKLTRKGALSEGDVDKALREVRIALLEADVALPVVKDFIDAVRDKAIGAEVLRSVTPGQMVVKIVHDELVEMLGGKPEEGEAQEPLLDLAAQPPVAVMLIGLQGSGKTTTCAKIAKRLTERERKKVIMASLDTQRPAAQHQLAVLGEQAGVATLPIVAGEPPLKIAQRAMQTGALEGYDVVLLDTAGRLSVDEELMAEVAAIGETVKPRESLLVADAMTGQDAVNVATAFQEKVGLTGIVLTRVDGDARGGAALSMRAVTGRPIKLLGTGEKLDAIEAFHADRVVGRILGMGDIVSLVERAAETIEQDEAEKLAKRLEKGQFDLNDMSKQLQQLTKMGGLKQLMGMLPGVPKLQDQIKNAKIDDKVVKRQLAIISSMTPQERARPVIIKASRRQRIAAGSGTSVQEVNRLLKQFSEAQKMMRKVRKMGRSGRMPNLPGMPAGGLPPGGLGGGGSGGGFGGLGGLGGLGRGGGRGRRR